MAKPVIFEVSAAWDEHAFIWSGHCDALPAAVDAPSLDELLAKMSAMALDVLPDNHPGANSGAVYLKVSAQRLAASYLHVISDEERAAIAEARKGGLSSDEGVAAFWKRHGIP